MKKTSRRSFLLLSAVGMCGVVGAANALAAQPADGKPAGIDDYEPGPDSKPRFTHVKQQA